MMTGARFKQLKEGAVPTDEAERRDFERLLLWEKRSNSAKQAVKTKLAKYPTWPTRRGDHKMMKAKVVDDALVLLAVHKIEGEVVLETTCRDYDHYVTLPQVVEYEGRECGKTGWSSDTNRACYKSGVMIAHGRR